MSAVSVSGLRMHYGGVEAVRGVDLTIEEGEVFALLGPNGAGKTTIVEILEGYRKRTAGDVDVLGFDPERNERDFKERIGIVLQESSVERELTVAETIETYGRYYPERLETGELIDIVGLGEKADARVKTLSGGQKRRLEVALGIVGNPDLVFLDEPTTGFDPAARRQAWGMIRNLRQLGKTILLTTHYMFEAEELCDRIAIIKEGKIVALDTPSELKRRVSGDSVIDVQFKSGGANQLERLKSMGDRIVLNTTHINGHELVSIRTKEPSSVMEVLAPLLEHHQIQNLEVRNPTLEDVYISIIQEGQDSA